MKITKLGHCCLLIEENEVRFLTDPGNYTTAQNEIKNIDAVVISHEHSDHLHVESLKTVISNNPNVVVICNASVGKILEKEGMKQNQISDGQSTEIKNVKISGYGLKHAPIFREYEQVENTGYMFSDRLFYPGDAFLKPDVKVDILAFPVTGPWCNISDAMNYVLEVRPQVAFAVHDGNLLRPTGVTKRLPEKLFSENEIEFHYLDLGKEYEF